MENYALSPTEMNMLSDYLIENYLIISKSPEKNPVGILLGGQSGSGKSTISDMLMKTYKQNMILINADEYRTLHPKYEEIHQKYGKDDVLYTQKFSGSMAEILINKLSDKKYNLIIEGTLRTSEVPLKTQKILSVKGYTTELHVMAVKPLISYYSTILRYEVMLKKGLPARATPKEHHDNIVNNIAKNLNEIYSNNVFNNIVIINRNQDCLYNQKNTPDIKPGSILTNMFNSRWSFEEVKNMKAILNKTHVLMKNRQAPGLMQFKEIENKLLQYIEKNGEKESVKNKLKNVSHDI